MNFISMPNWTNNNGFFFLYGYRCLFVLHENLSKSRMIFSTLWASSVRKLFPSAVLAKISFLGMWMLCICMHGPEASSSLSSMGPWEREIDNISHFTRRLPNCCSPLCTPNSARGPPKGERKRQMSCSRGLTFCRRWKEKEKWKTSLLSHRISPIN